MGEPLLEMRSVRKSFAKGTAALDDVSLSLPDDRPTLLTIAGESGCGKSTLALIANGFLRADGGPVRLLGRDIAAAVRDPRWFRRQVQAVFQNPFEGFNPSYRVEHPLHLTIRRLGLAAGKAEAQRLVEAALASVRLDPARIIGRYPHQLSGGQLQRVSIARAMLPRPRLLIADEPVSMLDASLRLSILRQLVEFKERDGLSIVYITHDLSTALRISDQLMIMRKGRVVDAGDPQRIVEAPRDDYVPKLLAAVPRISAHQAKPV